MLGKKDKFEKVPLDRQNIAVDLCTEEYCINKKTAQNCVKEMSNKLENGLPYKALQEGVNYLDSFYYAKNVLYTLRRKLSNS